MAKRGLLAELQHQGQLAAKRQKQAASAAARQRVAAARQAEQARKQSERAHAQMQRATAAQQKEAEREAKRLHIEAMEAEAASLNAELTSDLDDIDSILSFTLGVDDFVDLEALRSVVQHPPFGRADLERPTPTPPPLLAPPEPSYFEPADDATGLGKMFGGKKRHAEAVAEAQRAYWAAHEEWQSVVNGLPAAQLKQMQAHQNSEQKRASALADARDVYKRECDQREAIAQAANAELDALITGLSNNDASSVQEYISIVLGNSVYPDRFPVEHDFEFDASLKELSLTVTVPPPEELPVIKEYRYVKAKDDISSSEQTQKARRDRYTGAVHQVALRTLHEVFEADRDGRIETIALTVGANGIDVGTGQATRAVFVAVAADRSTFTTFDLANVVPEATLQHLNAVVSKNRSRLVGIDETKGVRGK